MNNNTVQADKITKENLLFSHIENKNIIDHEKYYYSFKRIKYWIEINQGRLYKSLAKGAKSIILNTNELYKASYDYYKSKGKQIYLIDDVVSFLNSTYPDITPPEINIQKKNTLLDFKKSSHDNEIIRYIKSSQAFINAEVNRTNTNPSGIGFMLQSKKRYKYAMIYFIIAVKKEAEFAKVYLSLAKLFEKFNLPKEAIETCELGLLNINIQKNQSLIELEEYYKELLAD